MNDYKKCKYCANRLTFKGECCLDMNEYEESHTCDFWEAIEADDNCKCKFFANEIEGLKEQLHSKELLLADCREQMNAMQGIETNLKSKNKKLAAVILNIDYLLGKFEEINHEATKVLFEVNEI